MLSSFAVCLVVVMFLWRTTVASPIPRSAGIALPTYLTECEQKLQKQCVIVFGTPQYFPVKGTCQPDPLINCLELFMENHACKENDPGTIPYVKDFVKRLRKKFVVGGVCLSQLALKEVKELFGAPDEFHLPAVDPTSYGSGLPDTVGDMYYDDTESDGPHSPGSAGGAGQGSGFSKHIYYD